jgi:toxin FitB
VLARWLDGLRTNNADRTLSIDDSGAIACGRLMARRPLPVPIGLITATARVHNLTLVTRNLADLVDTDVGVVTPWAQ